ncbi:hypothetical protein ACQ86N_37935 [Puia sp. P3]|uniref:hypothetical protein n=1 Tax=Puia sp. P3 TaxID=3423952 RepID=UPI003D66C6D7
MLETIICLVLVFALLSLLVGTLTEMINNWKNERGRMLFEGIVKMFANGADINFGEMLYKHPMVAAIFKTPDRPPMYISNFMFSQALIDTIVNHGRKFIKDEDVFKLFQAGVNNMKGDSDLKLLLVNMIEKSISYSGGYPGKVLTMLDQQIQQVVQRPDGPDDRMVQRPHAAQGPLHLYHRNAGAQREQHPPLQIDIYKPNSSQSAGRRSRNRSRTTMRKQNRIRRCRRYSRPIKLWP